MDCNGFREALVGDEPIDRTAIERHAAACEACAALREDHRRLDAAARAWKDAAPAPPARLEARVVAALEREARLREPARGEVVRPRIARWLRRDPTAPSPAARRLAPWAAVAAAVVIVALLLVQGVFAPFGGGELSRAVRQVERAERDYVRAIARLENEAAQVLARAGDPALPPEQAAILISYRDRLSHLDAVIAEVRQFLDEHPGHSGGHTVLLAAYKEKDEVLRKILERDSGDVS